MTSNTSTPLDHVLTTLQQRVSYLRCSSDAPPEDGWISCAELIADPDRLRAEIDSTAAGRGSDDPQVAASLFTQAYGFRVPSIAVAAFALGLPTPSTDPAYLSIRLGRHRPAEVAIVDQTCRVVSISDFVEALFDQHLAPFIAAVRTKTRVGERLLWGNVAASLATIFRALDVAPMGDAVVRAKAIEFERAASPWLAGLGSYSTIETPGAVGWFWTRTNCCLWYQTTSGFSCDDCSLFDPDELATKRLAELTGSVAS